MNALAGIVADPTTEEVAPVAPVGANQTAASVETNQPAASVETNQPAASVETNQPVASGESGQTTEPVATEEINQPASENPVESNLSEQQGSQAESNQTSEVEQTPETNAPAATQNDAPAQPVAEMSMGARAREYAAGKANAVKRKASNLKDKAVATWDNYWHPHAAQNQESGQAAPANVQSPSSPEAAPGQSGVSQAVQNVVNAAEQAETTSEENAATNQAELAEAVQDAAAAVDQAPLTAPEGGESGSTEAVVDNPAGEATVLDQVPSTATQEGGESASTEPAAGNQNASATSEQGTATSEQAPTPTEQAPTPTEQAPAPSEQGAPAAPNAGETSTTTTANSDQAAQNTPQVQRRANTPPRVNGPVPKNIGDSILQRMVRRDIRIAQGQRADGSRGADSNETETRMAIMRAVYTIGEVQKSVYFKPITPESKETEVSQAVNDAYELLEGLQERYGSIDAANRSPQQNITAAMIRQYKNHLDRESRGGLVVPEAKVNEQGERTDEPTTRSDADVDMYKNVKGSKEDYTERNYADKALFPSMPKSDDVMSIKGNHSAFILALDAMVRKSPEKIVQSMRDNGDTVTVRLYDTQSDGEPKPVYVTVKKVYVQRTGESGVKGQFSAGRAFWVMMMERAYAASGLHVKADGTKGEAGYGDMATGSFAAATAVLTGKSALVVNSSSDQPYDTSLFSRFCKTFLQKEPGESEEERKETASALNARLLNLLQDVHATAFDNAANFNRLMTILFDSSQSSVPSEGTGGTAASSTSQLSSLEDMQKAIEGDQELFADQPLAERAEMRKLVSQHLTGLLEGSDSSHPDSYSGKYSKEANMFYSDMRESLARKGSVNVQMKKELPQSIRRSDQGQNGDGNRENQALYRNYRVRDTIEAVKGKKSVKYVVLENPWSFIQRAYAKEQDTLQKRTNSKLDTERGVFKMELNEFIQAYLNVTMT
ncbi:MAG: hypothetical protein R3Y62_00100 [Eubacteriales bacterium]